MTPEGLARRETESSKPQQHYGQTVLSILAVDCRQLCLYCQGMPRNTRKRAKAPRADVRERLLDAADRLFYREGVRVVGIDRILAEAEAAKASLYQHFGCKDELVASYLERRTADSRANIEAYLANTPPSQRALRFFAAGVEWWKSRPFRGCPWHPTVSRAPLASHPAGS